MDAAARAATKLGYSNKPAVSGAGHDAVYMAKLASAGCNLQLHAMLERAEPVHK